MLTTNLLILKYLTKSNVLNIDKQDVRKHSMQLLRQINRSNCEDNNNINYYYYYYLKSFTYNKIYTIKNTQDYL